MNDRARQAEIQAVMGASGSGKTSYVMDELRRRKPSRLLVWDTKREFANEGHAEPVENLGELVAVVVKAGKRGGFKLSYQPKGDDKAMKKQFDLFCRLAFEAKNLTMVAEELADVTTASYAVAGWRRCTSMGRTEGLTIYGLSQRPASVDKHFWGNASLIRTGRLNFAADIKTMSNAIGVKDSEIKAMIPLQWVGRNMNTGGIARGNLAGKAPGEKNISAPRQKKRA